ncbi:hypothetical protein [Synechococcus sp. RedBA-s]|uniref:hypothetical protein n=1 Tax=Synechococcus sp. RedBA-s TaxID=2823741 RepID=UPI0020CD5E3D|nr:hypothetical protein [Synechococcus sp. RedBA-s]MCP9799913.1 hypothetical protein [Synechococcus sp. RedBA-s]
MSATCPPAPKPSKARRASGTKLTPQQRELLRAVLFDLAKELRPLTVRGLYYQAVISTALPFITKDSNRSRRSYGFVQHEALTLRVEGVIPWSWIVDESRPDYSVARWYAPAGFA